MITVALLNICVVFYAYLARHKRTEFWLKGSFVLIFLFLALRYDYGNDYYNYLHSFIKMNQVETIDYFDKYWVFEPGWIFLCRLFRPLGFFAMTAFLALFNCFVYYRFIKKYVPPNYYWLAVFLYIFNPSFMLIHSSMMRQSVAISLFVFSIDYIYKKKALYYFICAVLASLFHTSALVLLPVYLLGLFNFKINKMIAVCLFLALLSMFVFGKLFLPYINQATNMYFNKYELFSGGSEIGSGLGLVIYLYFIVLILYYVRLQASELSLLFKIAFISYVFIPLGMVLMMLGRVGMYFQPATIVVFPIILFNMKSKKLKAMTLLLIALISMYSYYEFFNSDVWKVAFGTYKTVFSAPEIY